MFRRLVAASIGLAERGLPDAWIRAGSRRIVAARMAKEGERAVHEVEAMLRRWHEGPIAILPEAAKEQHYEVPAAFFELILGPRLKYSSCLWGDGTQSLGEAENAMLALTAARAGIEDGMRVLDLGCGWGSMTLWLAEHYPASTIVGVSNSASQGRHIRSVAEARGLANVQHVVSDVNHLVLDGRFDAVVSVEMLEHVRNHPALLERLAASLAPGAPMLVHVFAHRRHLWEFEDDGPGDWMARTFFSGGIMPSHDRFDRLVAPADIEESWWVNGLHYRRTLEAWLQRLDAQREEVAAVLQPVYGRETDRWVQRWRMFLMATSEFFGWESGDAVGVGHHRLRLN